MARGAALFVMLVGVGCASAHATPGDPKPKGSDAADAAPISPWWQSLFVEGATSVWDYTYRADWTETKPDGTDVDGHDERATVVRCKVTEVQRRAGGVVYATIACTQDDSKLQIDVETPQATWATDGRHLWSGVSPKEALGEPLFEDPPTTRTVDRGPFQPAIQWELKGDTYCMSRDAGEGGSGVCFRRGVGPTTYHSNLRPGGRTTSETLTRRP